MVFPANKPELPPLPPGRPARWRKRSAARWGATVGIAFSALQLWRSFHDFPPAPGQPAALAFGVAVAMASTAFAWAVLFVIVAMLHNLMLPAEIKRLP